MPPRAPAGDRENGALDHDKRMPQGPPPGERDRAECPSLRALRADTAALPAVRQPCRSME
ncbi:hypothetical protein GCM10022403_002720 [Streptomyces coacervatus]|uniref:Uncharacterized protein n=1 Tax=Streptomyces coacervatus TaxID=647381 RepID=A0ABP7GU84_9ACTN